MIIAFLFVFLYGALPCLTSKCLNSYKSKDVSCDQVYGTVILEEQGLSSIQCCAVCNLNFLCKSLIYDIDKQTCKLNSGIASTFPASCASPKSLSYAEIQVSAFCTTNIHVHAAKILIDHFIKCGYRVNKKFFLTQK